MVHLNMAFRRRTQRKTIYMFYAYTLQPGYCPA